MTDQTQPVRPTAMSAAPSVALPAALGARRVAAALGRHPDILGIATVLLLTALVSWHRLYLENGLAHLDIPTFYLPWYAHLGESIRAFDIPGWNPYVFSGTAFAGDPQSGWWYFPAMAIFAALEPVRAYEVYLIFHLALAGVTAYLFCRQLGMKAPAALVGAAAFELGPLVTHISCCLINVQLGAWIPTALIGVELTVRGRHWSQRGLGWVVTGLAISQMLAGWPGQGAYNALLLIGSYLAFRTLIAKGRGILGWRDRVIRLVGDGIGVLGFGFAIGAAGLLPRLDVVSRTNVAGGEYSGFGVDNYSSGWRVFTILQRSFTDQGGYRPYLFYLGAPTLILMIAALVLAWRRFSVVYFAAMTLVVGILALKPTPLHRLFFLLPRFEELHTHVPNRILTIQWIGPPVLAAAAVDALLRRRRGPRILTAAMLAVAVWGGIATLMLASGKGVSLNSTASAAATAAVVAVFATLAVAPDERQFAYAKRARLGLAGLLLLLVVWDPTGHGVVSTLRSGDPMNQLLVLPTGPIPREAIEIDAATTDPGGAGEFLQGRQAAGEVFRYFGYEDVLQNGGRGYPSTYREHFANPLAIDLLVNARAMRLHLYDAQGYNPVQLVNYVGFLNEVNEEVQNYHDAQILPGGLTSPLLDILNARYIVIPNEIGSPGRLRPDLVTLLATYPEVYRNASIRVLENPGAVERAWLVHDVRQVTAAAIPGLLRSEEIDPRTTLLIADGGGDFPATGPAAAPEAGDAVEILSYEPDRIRLRVTTARPGAVVLSETYDEGWHATVAGNEAPVHEAFGVIRAVPVGAGESIVELRYDPRSLRLGFAISIAAAVAAVATVVVALSRRRRARPRGAAALNPDPRTV